MNKSESERMVEEAYNVIDFPPEYIPVRHSMPGWLESNTVLMQMANTGLITRREAMERMEIHE